MLGDAAGRAAVAAGLSASPQWQVEGVVAQPTVTSQDQAVGVLGAGAGGLGRAVTIFAVFAHQLDSVAMCAAVLAVEVIAELRAR